MSRETGRNCKACERWEVTQWGLMVSACSAELNSRTGNRGFLLHPHAHTSCTRRVPTGRWYSVPHGGSPLLTTAPTLLLVQSHMTAHITCNSQPVFLIPGHEKNSGLLPSAPLKQASWAKHILGVLHTLSAFTIPLSLLGQYKFYVVSSIV